MSSDERDLELGESTPLIGGKKPLGELPEFSWRERAVAVLAATSVAASVVSIIVSLGNPLVIVSAVLGLLAAPYVVFQQQKITQCLALLETNKRVREEVDTLNRENRKLQENVEQLETSVKNLKVQKEKLDIIQSTQVTSLEALENQLEESKEILDLDGDDVLQDNEIDDLIVKLERLNGVDFKDDLVRQAIVDNGRSIDAIMALVKNLMSQDVEERNKFFHITEQ